MTTVASASPAGFGSDEVCWVCLSTEAESGEALSRPCACPRLCHLRCLARWQLQSCGKEEEAKCRFCHSLLPKWQSTLVPVNVKPITPVMAIKFEGKTYKLKVKPGADGLAEFQHQVRHLLGFDITDDFDVTFECSVNGEKMKLSGLQSYGAATQCAAITAAQREVKPRRSQRRHHSHPSIQQPQQPEQPQQGTDETTTGYLLAPASTSMPGGATHAQQTQPQPHQWQSVLGAATPSATAACLTAGPLQSSSAPSSRAQLHTGSPSTSSPSRPRLPSPFSCMHRSSSGLSTSSAAATTAVVPASSSAGACSACCTPTQRQQQQQQQPEEVQHNSQAVLSAIPSRLGSSDVHSTSCPCNAVAVSALPRNHSSNASASPYGSFDLEDSTDLQATAATLARARTHSLTQSSHQTRQLQQTTQQGVAAAAAAQSDGKASVSGGSGDGKLAPLSRRTLAAISQFFGSLSGRNSNSSR